MNSFPNNSSLNKETEKQKLATLHQKGEELFGNVDKFKNWLQKPIWNDIERPIDMLETPDGIDFIMDELMRLAYGDVI